MSMEEDLQKQLIEKFPCLEGGIRVQRVRRLWADVPADKFFEVFNYARESLGFVILSTITGLDEGEYLAFVYHLARENGIIINIKFAVPKANPVIKTVTKYFPAAEMYEREVEDLLGAKVEGLPAGRHYPLPEDWPAGQYPLRKDWQPDMAGLKTGRKEEGK